MVDESHEPENEAPMKRVLFELNLKYDLPEDCVEEVKSTDLSELVKLTIPTQTQVSLSALVTGISLVPISKFSRIRFKFGRSFRIIEGIRLPVDSHFGVKESNLILIKSFGLNLILLTFLIFFALLPSPWHLLGVLTLSPIVNNLFLTRSNFIQRKRYKRFSSSLVIPKRKNEKG